MTETTTTTISDDMCRAAIEAGKPDRIQGFTYEINGQVTHVVRDLTKPVGDSAHKLWVGSSHPEMMERCAIERMRLQLAAALAAPSPAPAAPSAAQWMPIETAPKDGTDILLYAPAGECEGKPTDARTTVGHWTTEEECRRQVGDCGGECRCPEYDHDDPYWLSWDGGFLPELPPTHWMPLPAAPGAQPAQGGSVTEAAEAAICETIKQYRKVQAVPGSCTGPLTIDETWLYEQICGHVRAAIRSAGEA